MLARRAASDASRWATQASTAGGVTRRRRACGPDEQQCDGVLAGRDPARARAARTHVGEPFPHRSSGGLPRACRPSSGTAHRPCRGTAPRRRGRRTPSRPRGRERPVAARRPCVPVRRRAPVPRTTEPCEEGSEGVRYCSGMTSPSRPHRPRTSLTARLALLAVAPFALLGACGATTRPMSRPCRRTRPWSPRRRRPCLPTPNRPPPRPRRPRRPPPRRRPRTEAPCTEAAVHGAADHRAPTGRDAVDRPAPRGR